MTYEHQDYPQYLYHPTLAPSGKLFASADETKGLSRQGWVDSPAKFPKPVRRGAKGFWDRYRRLSMWNKLAFWGTVASLASLVIYFLPTRENTKQVAAVSGSPGSTIMQPGRDLVIQGPAPSQTPTLLPAQERLLELVAAYQREFAASRLVVGRKDGRLHFDEDPNRGAKVSLVADLFGTVSTHNAGRFEELVQNMPVEFLRVTSEGRFDNPFVLSITQAGMQRVVRR